MPSPELQSPASWIWKPCSCPGLRPLTSATTRTLSPICVKVAVPAALLPFVGCKSALALGPDGAMLWHPASAAAATKSTILTSCPSRPDSSWRWQRPCRLPWRGRRRPSPSTPWPSPLRPPCRPRSSAVAAAAWPARPSRRSSRRRAGPGGFSSWLLLHVRRARGHGAAGGFGAAPGLHLFVPVEMVLLRPRLIRIAVAHVVVRVLDADRSHVDVAEGRGDVEKRRRDVPDPGFLHRVARLVEVREEQHEAAPRHDDAE